MLNWLHLFPVPWLHEYVWASMVSSCSHKVVHRELTQGVVLERALWTKAGRFEMKGQQIAGGCSMKGRAGDSSEPVWPIMNCPLHGMDSDSLSGRAVFVSHDTAVVKHLRSTSFQCMQSRIAIVSPPGWYLTCYNGLVAVGHTAVNQ